MRAFISLTKSRNDSALRGIQVPAHSPVHSLHPYRRIDASRAIALYGESGSLDMVSTALGCAESTVDKILRRNGVTRKLHAPNKGRAVEDFPTEKITRISKMVDDQIRNAMIPEQERDDLASVVWLHLLTRTWPSLTHEHALFMACYRRTLLEIRGFWRNVKRRQGYGKWLNVERTCDETFWK